jgi:hypothetical protein
MTFAEFTATHRPMTLDQALDHFLCDRDLFHPEAVKIHVFEEGSLFEELEDGRYYVYAGNCDEFVQDFDEATRWVWDNWADGQINFNA